MASSLTYEELGMEAMVRRIDEALTTRGARNLFIRDVGYRVMMSEITIEKAIRDAAKKRQIPLRRKKGRY